MVKQNKMISLCVFVVCLFFRKGGFLFGKVAALLEHQVLNIVAKKNHQD